MSHLYERVLMRVSVLFKRPKSSRYCRRPLLNNLTASIASSFIASGESHFKNTFLNSMQYFAYHPQDAAQRARLKALTTSKARINSDATSLLLIGFSVIFTLMDPVPQSLWASYHVFGLLSCGQGLCTAILTLTAEACVRTRT